ncbi:hypothetical protein Tco_1261684 [Tanacetum coccineum]
MFTTIKIVCRHEDTHLYGTILSNEFMNEDIRNSKSYKEYYVIASGAEPPKIKESVKKKQVGSDKTKTPPTTKGKRLKTFAKAAKPAKKKQLAKTSKAKGLTVLSEVTLTDAEQMKLATKRSLIETHGSYASGSGADEGTVAVNDEDNMTMKMIDGQWMDDDDDDNDDDDDDDDNDDDDNDDHNNDADNQDDDRQEYDKHDDEEQGDDDEQTNSDNDGDDFIHPNDDESNEESDEEVQGAIIEEEEMDEEATHEEEEANELYRYVNVNLEGRDTVMADAPQTNVQGTQVTEDTHVIIPAPVNPEGQQQSSSVSSGFVSNMLNPSPDLGIDSIFNLNTKATSLVDVPVTTIAEPPLLSATTLPPPPTPLITHLLKTLENNFSEFNQTNQFATAVSSISGIFDAYIANKMHEAVKTADQVKEQVKAQASKILPKIEKTINEQLEAEVLTHSSNESKTSHAVAANLSELELKKILIDKMKSNKSINRSDEQRNLYKALVDAYESDKLILNTYGDTVSFKSHRDDEDKYKEPFAGSNRGSKRRRAGKEPEYTSAPKEKTSKTTGKSTEGSKSHHKSVGESAQAEDPMHTAKDLEELAHQEFETGVTEDQPNEETFQHPDWFQKPAKPPTSDHDWNKTLPNAHGPVQPWLSSLAQMEDPSESFNELIDTPLDFSTFVMNRLKVNTLTPELLTGPTFELMKGSCKSLVELEYFLEEVYKATTDQLDWINPEGQQYPHDMDEDKLQITGISNGLNISSLTECGVKCRLAMTNMHSGESHIGGENDNNSMDLWLTGNPFEMSTPNAESLDDEKLYKFKEGDFNRLRIQDIEDMLLFLVQGKLTNLTVEERLAFNVSLRMFTRSVVIQRRVEDIQLGVESYQKKLNLPKPDMYRSDLKRREAYTTYSNPRGFIYQNKDKKNKLMRIDELHKFSDGTLNDVWTALDYRLKGIWMKYLPQTIWR